MKITIIPYGEMGPDIAERLVDGLNRVCHASASLGAARPLPPGAFDQARRQYATRAFLDDLRDHVRNATGKGVDLPIGLAAVDLFVSRMSFVFGEADPESGTALISALRLRPEYYQHPADEGLLDERLLKEAIHEHGHVAGFSHCSDPRCIMHFSNTIEDTDCKDRRLCPRCAADLPQIGADYLC